MDYSITAKELLKELGGVDNIHSVTHCMTRLRFILKDESGVRDEQVKSIKGVMGVNKKGGQYQVIIGNDVGICYAEFMKLGKFGEDMAAVNSQKKEKITVSLLANQIVDAISGSIAPILPAIIGCGMLRLVVTILDLLHISAELPTYQILVTIGDAGFYFLPIILAASAAKKFGCSQPLAMTITAVLVHPNLITLFAGGNTSFLTLPVTAAAYSSSVIPSLLIAWLLSKVEPAMDRHMKGWVKTVFKPTLILLIGTPLALIVIAPLGAFVGNGLAFVLTWLQTRMGWLMSALLSAFMPLIVMAGMHYALIPNCLTNLGTLGFDMILGPTMLASNFSQAAACAAVALKSKNQELKAVAATSSVSAAIAGITEPALYGVTLRLKRPLIASMIGSGAAGLFAGVTGLQNYALVTPSLVAMVQFVSADLKRNFLYACITVVISVVVTFIMTLVLGWNDEVEENLQNGEEHIAVYPELTAYEITSPLYGKVIPLSQVNDDTFATGVLGKGVAIQPTDGRVYAPFDGTVATIFETRHAIGLISDVGTELLIHVGLETVTLKGEGFELAVEPGASIKRGDLLIKFDLKMLKQKGFDVTTPIIVSNHYNYQEVLTYAEQDKAEKTTKILEVINQEKKG